MHKFSSARALALTCALAAALGTSACSSADLVGNNAQTVSLSFAADANGGFASAVDANGAVVSSAAPTSPVPIVTKVQLVLTKMELGRTDDVECVGESDDDNVASSSSTPPVDKGHSCEYVSRDPVLIDMPVDGTLRTQLSVPLAPGSYRKLEAKLEPANARHEPGAAFLHAHPDFAGVSIRVEGTHNGVPFAFKSSMKAVLHMRFKPPLVIDATTKNATVAVDVSKWFVSIHGEVLDPSKAATGTPARKIIENNIRASFRAFKDDNKRGKDEGK